MTSKKEKAKVSKLLNQLDNQNKEKLKIEKELKELRNKNILEFGNKVYQNLQVDYLDKDDMKKLLNKLSEDTMSIYEVKYNELIEDIKGYMKFDGQVDFHKAKKLYEKIKD